MSAIHASPSVTSIGPGTTLSLLPSAMGWAFLAWGPNAAIASAREAELCRTARQRSLVPDIEPTKAGLAKLVEAVRGKGFASVDGRYIPGLVAAAAPVLDWQGEAQAVITLVGTDPSAIDDGSGQIAALRVLPETFSRRKILIPKASKRRGHPAGQPKDDGPGPALDCPHGPGSIGLAL